MKLTIGMFVYPFLLFSTFNNHLVAQSSRIPAHGTTPEQRVHSRRNFLEQSQQQPLNLVESVDGRVGQADQKNCENMFGHLVIPLGAIHPLRVSHSNGTTFDYVVPVATTEGALVASLNRGAKALALAESVTLRSTYVGVTRAPVLRVAHHYSVDRLEAWVIKHAWELRRVAQKTSSHLKLMNISLFKHSPYLFARCSFDTDQAMGMNMATIASRALVDFIITHVGADKVSCPALSSNLCTDKKPSTINAELCRGYNVIIVSK